MGIGTLKVIGTAFALMFASIAMADRYPYFPPPGMGYVSSSSQMSIDGNIQFIAPPVTDPAPIIQNANIGYSVSGFPGNYYSDPVVGVVGYNAVYAPGTVTCVNLSTDWCFQHNNEMDYEHPALGLGQTGIDTGTAGSGTTTTTLVDGGGGWGAGNLIDYVLYDVTANASSLIASNTSTTITVNPAIAGMTNGDAFEILRRDGEIYTRILWNGSAIAFQPEAYTIDKGRSLATGVLHLMVHSALVPNDASYGYEFISDSCTANCGSGSNDILTIAKNALDLFAWGGGDSVLIIGNATTGGSFNGNGRIDMYSGNGTSNVLTSRITAVQAGRYLVQLYDSGGNNGVTGIDLNRNGTDIIGDSTLAPASVVVNSGSSGTIALRSRAVIVGPVGGTTIAGLPTCNAALTGARSYVTNGVTAPTFLSAVSTTGANVDPVFCNGTNWVYD